MRYRDAFAYLYSFLNYEVDTHYRYDRDLNLGRMNQLMKILGNPHKRGKFVLVAGTKGKGSTAFFLASILNAAGYRTGLYTSPHLYEPTERIRLGGRPISKERFAGVLTKIRARLDAHPVPARFGPVTFFEILTAAAFVYFAEEKADIAIMEVGLGGRLDATNVAKPLVSVVTRISYDHMDKLGNSLNSIAAEKIGILKQKGILVSGSQNKGVETYFKRVLGERNAAGGFYGRDFTAEALTMNETGTRFDFRSKRTTIKRLRTRLAGGFQAENAACAVAAAQVLKGQYGFRISEADVHKGLSARDWHGRFEKVSDDPLCVLDGAHNGDSMRALAESVDRVYPGRNVILILGVSRDKDIKRILDELHKLNPSRWIATQADTPRSLPAGELAERAARVAPRAESADTVPAALDRAITAASGDDLILVTGSLFTVAEARKYLKKRKVLV